MIAALDLGTEPLAARALVQILQVAGLLAAVAKPHTVKAREIG